MGDIADAMLEGLLCEGCGVAMIDGPDDDVPGHTRRCRSCARSGMESELNGEPDEISDSEMWQALKERAKSKKQSNQQQSTDILRSRGVPFESKNHGVHLIVRQGDRVFDFWPSTGRWIERDRVMNKALVAHHRSPKQQGRGVFNLLEALGA